MDTSALKLGRDDTFGSASNPNLTAFANDLSELCRRYGMGIAGNPTLFLMEPVDYSFTYHVDHTGVLLGW
jgi:hypothetical protein